MKIISQTGLQRPEEAFLLAKLDFIQIKSSTGVTNGLCEAILQKKR